MFAPYTNVVFYDDDPPPYKYAIFRGEGGSQYLRKNPVHNIVRRQTYFTLPCIQCIFNCPRYDDRRQKILFNWYTGPTEDIYFCNIMSSGNENTIRNTAFLINKLLKIVNYT